VTQKLLFPFSALIGQPLLQQALLLAAIDPGIGGVLIEGPRGTAKSTSARAIAELLPAAEFVTLPLGASEEQLIGTLDIGAALQGGSVKFAPGLLAKAHAGVLYVDEVNLLPDGLVDQLLDVAASGTNIVERDGISHQHPARFVLIGTMNREEGELRPQLLDRFGLALLLTNNNDAKQRSDIVKARLAFDADPSAFRARLATAQQLLIETIQRARAALTTLTFNDAVHDRVSALCIEAGVDGMRADLVMLRAARALAALQGVRAIGIEHVDGVAELALYHRRNAAPRQAPSKNSDLQNSTDSEHTDLKNGDRSSDDRQIDNRTLSSGTDNKENTWGAMPPPSITALPIDTHLAKGVKPFPQKKH
jgi:magnesium chelatase subunit I